jgi:hypothetical protein
VYWCASPICMALRDMLKGKTVINTYIVDVGGAVRKVVEELDLEPNRSVK